jgi:predicted membrane channel-forming protein YqfA (hemolysin III family)
MELPQKMNCSRDVFGSSDKHPGQINWDYDRAEIIADGIVHVIGVCLGILGAVTIVAIAVGKEGTEVAPIWSTLWACS